MRWVGLDMRPLWPGMGAPPRSLRWQHHGDDLIEALEATNTGPVIGMGHSMGATATVFAAAKRPDLFRALVLIEPAFVPRALTMWDRITPFALRRLFEPGKSTLTRRDRWADAERFFRAYRGRGLFRAVPEPVLREFCDAALVQDNDGDGVRLAFSRQWEAHHYMCPASIWPELSRVTVPVIAIHGDDSVFLTGSAWRAWKRRHPEHRLCEMPGRGHLVPFEAPREVADLVREQLARTL